VAIPTMPAPMMVIFFMRVPEWNAAILMFPVRARSFYRQSAGSTTGGAQSISVLW